MANIYVSNCSCYCPSTAVSLVQDSMPLRFLCELKKFASVTSHVSSHKLEIEIGRYHRPKRKPDERLCQVCDATEDEMHCLMSCKLNQDLRFRFFEEITRRYPSFQHMGVKDRFIFIMKTPKLSGNQLTYDFIDQCLSNSYKNKDATKDLI